ncbi:MAG: hypothetical protein JKY25_01300 [Robiginitomaculum sp.]|nr:hypothetical protein [Robiginitomaculum sp.]
MPSGGAEGIPAANALAVERGITESGTAAGIGEVDAGTSADTKTFANKALIGITVNTVRICASQTIRP